MTQAVDAESSTLGFFLEWIKEFARQCERVDVIALSVGAHDLPANVRVFSMGKERGVGRSARLFNFWKHLRHTLPQTDAVFVHMCPEYLIAGWPLFAFARKQVVLWYAHRHRDWKVRLGVALADIVATSVENALTVRTSKKRALGQGVPTDLFLPLPPPAAPPFRFAAIGRLTPIKRLELLIEATAMLRNRGLDAVLELWGAPAVPSDADYETSLRNRARTLGISEQVRFLGAVPFSDMPKKYGGVNVALNACPKGAIDKAVLEAMSCARPVIVTNENFSSVLGPDSSLCLAVATAESIADKIEALCAADRQAIGLRLREAVVARHGLPRLVRGTLALYRANRAA